MIVCQILRLMFYHPIASLQTGCKLKYSGTLTYESPNLQVFRDTVRLGRFSAFELKAEIQVTNQLQIPHRQLVQ